ncbi:hypothetical protein MOQ_002512 [Trypanosoma cruzi marinkellei]|uniref:WW domain-containing protein n=1 Tax=Trypanosoma cruzi marinkellei TaxID=85056 RepID=K2N295_TRYCR|nr:hypothetical protein MOQ_002512 [Trypanosoma cruzi marinkellei]
MPTVNEVQPRSSGSTLYIVRDVQGRQCLAPQSQPDNLNVTFLVKLDPKSGQEFYVNVTTRAKSWDLPDIDAERAADPSHKDGSELSPLLQTVEAFGTIYELTQCDGDERYVPKRLPFEPLPIHCWRPIREASAGRFLYENCETAERVTKLPPIEYYCDAVRQIYEFYGIEGSYVDAIRPCFGKENRLVESLSIQYGPRPLRSDEVMELAECYFQRHDKSMLGEMDSLLKQWHGNEIGFVDALYKEYGERPRTTRERVRAVYAQHCPSMIVSSDEQVDQYKERDDELFDALKIKFGPEMINGEEPLESIMQRVRCQFLKYDPERAVDIENILAKHKGAEVQLLELLVCHYGPEVSPEEREKLLKGHLQTAWNEAEYAFGDRWEADSNEHSVKETDTSKNGQTTPTSKETGAWNCNSDEANLRNYNKEELNDRLALAKLFSEEWAPATPRVVTQADSVAMEVWEGVEPAVSRRSSSSAAVDASSMSVREANETMKSLRLASSAPRESGSIVSTSFPNTDTAWRKHTEILETERRLREQEFQKQQQCIFFEEEKQAREFEAHQRLLAIERERRSQEEAKRIMEVAQDAAQHAVRELTRLQQLRDDGSGCDERTGDVSRQKEHRQAIEALASANEALMGQFSHMEAQLRDALGSLESYTERNEKLRAENLRVATNFSEMQRQYELELQGMRIYLDDTRVRLAKKINEQEVKMLHLKKEEETTTNNLRRELEIERNNAAKAKEAWELEKTELRTTIDGLQQQVKTIVEERDHLKAKLNSRDIVLSERTKEIEELYDTMKRQRAARIEAASQTEEFDLSVVLAEVRASEEPSHTSNALASLSPHFNPSVNDSPEANDLQKAYKRSQHTVLELLAVNKKMKTESEKAREFIGILRQRVRSLEATVEKLELRQLAVPDIPVCATEHDVVVVNLKEDLLKVGSRLLEADAESTRLKREIRDLRSLLSLYMSNTRKL